MFSPSTIRSKAVAFASRIRGGSGSQPLVSPNKGRRVLVEVEDVLGVIHNEMDNFKAFRASDSQWGKVRNALKRVGDIVLVFNDAAAEAATFQVFSIFS